eukprot:GEMP01066475.1.p1 GENE.GEMP01066475.1~~GEMP01066475.1.p1  ORF type:complete len:140 (+),score=17.47 GEMP01066475.1:408-827(+)
MFVESDWMFPQRIDEPAARNFSDMYSCVRDAVDRFFYYDGDRRRIDQEVIFSDDSAHEPRKEEPCAIIHNWCAASYNLEEGCRFSSEMCSTDRLKVRSSIWNRSMRWPIGCHGGKRCGPVAGLKSACFRRPMWPSIGRS